MTPTEALQRIWETSRLPRSIIRPDGSVDPVLFTALLEKIEPKFYVSPSAVGQRPKVDL
jgi:hypothetical protein